ncbi:hypothetical protein [Streptomyces synnematoformans]|uniref:Uncharacterized protein n=1 Tax=Streptomyces synnematoformans TaxID=415721 RepID=A0ABP5K2E5_9ACTN
MIFRTIANPRRTTLAHLDDAGDLLLPEPPGATARPGGAAAPSEGAQPERTANPRRTVLADVPADA